MYTVEMPAIVKFNDVGDARQLAKAIRSLITEADVVAGGVIIRNDDTYALVSVDTPKVDRSKYVTGAQDATDEATRLVDAITTSAYRQLESDHFAPVFELAARRGEVDLVLLRDLVQQGLYPDLADANSFLTDIISRVAAERASGSFRRLTAVKKPKGGK